MHVKKLMLVQIIKENIMEHEIRYFIKQIKACMEPEHCDCNGECGDECKCDVFKPTYLVTAVMLPTGAIELAVNNENIAEKMDYILEAYDDSMRLKTNPEIVMQNIMIV